MIMDMKPYQALKVSTVNCRATAFENLHVTLIERRDRSNHTSNKWSYSAVAIIQRTICINDVLHVSYNWSLRLL